VQAADAGRRRQSDAVPGPDRRAAVAQSLGAALYEEMVIDDNGRNHQLPNSATIICRPFADVPRTEVLFAETSDTLGGRWGAKSMSEKPLQSGLGQHSATPLPTLTGIRFLTRDAHFKPDRLFPGAASEVRVGLGLVAATRLPRSWAPRGACAFA